MLNEKIKYCRKPLEDIFDNVLPKEEKKPMKCISQLDDSCLKVFRTTKENRICDYCMRIVRRRQ